jgi:uncharacterized protein YqeY
MPGRGQPQFAGDQEIETMREAINAALKDAMKAGDKPRTGTLRLIAAAIKDREIEARGTGKTIGDDDLLQLLQKMVKQRQESASIYEGAGRAELAAQERAEIAVIQGFMPEQMSDEEVAVAIEAAVAETGAAGMRDMGKVMAALRERFAGRMDFGQASGTVKQRLSQG